MTGGHASDDPAFPSSDVAAAYDTVADLYATLFRDDLVDDLDAQPWVAEFVAMVDAAGGPVADLGCGPGHCVDFLVRAGVRSYGIDLSRGLVRQAQVAYPDLDFRVGDIAALDLGDGELGGIFSRYSIIHFPPEQLGRVLGDWARVVAPGAPLLLSFFASLEPDHHGTPFDHKVTTAYELFPATVGRLVADAGFTEVRVDAAPPAEGGRPLEKGVVLARREGI